MVGVGPLPDVSSPDCQIDADIELYNVSLKDKKLINQEE